MKQNEKKDFLQNAKKVYESNKNEGIRKTPLLVEAQKYSNRFIELKNTSVCFKLENMQKYGSFKIRGILNQRHHHSKGKLVTMSAGSYGMAFSRVFGERGVVVMPTNVPQDRIETCKKYGAHVQLADRLELQRTVDAYVDKGYSFCHPFDDELLLEGYASIAFEILEDVSDVDVIICGVGGGGLCSGISAAMKLMKKDLKIVGVEPEGAPAMTLALEADKVVHLEKVSTFVNGLSPPFVGSNTLKYFKRYVDTVVTVSDDQIVDAMKVLYSDYKLVVESSGAASVAALLNNVGMNYEGKKIVCILSGGNISIKELNEIIGSS